MKSKASLLIISSALLILGSCKLYEHRNKVVLTIGSGSENAAYYPVATAICDIFNKHTKDKNIVCEAKLSKGAEYNLDAVERGEFDMGIAQTNLYHDAYLGHKKFTGRPHENLHILFKVHNEYLTIIAKKDAHIRSFSDLRGKKVNIGNQGSGSRILFLQMIQKLGWSLDDFKEIYEESGSDIDKVLCTPNKADAAIYLVGHPNKSFESVINNCAAELVSLSESEIKSFISLSPKEFYKSSIPAGIYANSPKKVSTFASETLLFASKKSDENIADFVRVVSENKEELEKRGLLLNF